MTKPRICMLIVAASLSLPAFAGPLNWYQIYGVAANSPGAPTQTAVTFDTGQSDVPVSVSKSIAGGQGSASVDASITTNQGFTELHATLDAGAYAVQFGSGGANVYMMYRDTLTFHNSGTATYEFHLHLDDFISADYPTYHDSNADIQVTQLAGGVFFGHNLQTFDQPDIHSSIHDSVVDITIADGTVNAIELQLFAQIFASAYIDSNGLESNTAHLDASDTGYLTITALTPGATFDAASGTSYALPSADTSSVPEPGTIVMMVSGLTGLLRRRFCHKR